MVVFVLFSYLIIYMKKEYELKYANHKRNLKVITLKHTEKELSRRKRKGSTNSGLKNVRRK